MRRKEVILPFTLAVAAIAGTILDAPNYGPHEGGIVYPLLIAAAIVLAARCIAALLKKRWLRLIALLAALAVCIGCGEWLNRKQLCPECDREYFAIQENPTKDGIYETV